MESLLPSDFSQFRSEKFWNQFFRKRKFEPFEWYGEWSELCPLVTAACHVSDDILIPGCGNSELSARLYDYGIKKITNLDFSSVVITEMRQKNEEVRPLMRWMKMDMTATEFPDHSFDVILDKGGLDSLMADENEESERIGIKFLNEISRLLKYDGKYLCISLVQKQVIETLLHTLRENWEINIFKIPPPPPSPSPSSFSTNQNVSSLKPFLIEAIKRRKNVQNENENENENENINENENENKNKNESELFCLFPFPPIHFSVSKKKDIDADEDQMNTLLDVVNAENVVRKTLRSFGEASLQERDFKIFKFESQKFENFEAGRRKTIQILNRFSKCGQSQSQSQCQDGDFKSDGRFTLLLLDSKNIYPEGEGEGEGLDINKTKFEHECAVFITPQGREHEWLFSSEEGNFQLIENINSKRLIIVKLNRNNIFGSSQDVQSELSPFILFFSPKNCRDGNIIIPFMTTNDGIGKRLILEEVDSEITGKILIEEVEILDENEKKIYRRLIFKKNQNLIQSEFVLKDSKKSNPNSNSNPNPNPNLNRVVKNENAIKNVKEGKKKKNEKEKNGGKETGEKKEDNFKGYEVLEKDKIMPRGGDSLIDFSHLACEYHAAIVSGLSLTVFDFQKFVKENIPVNAMIVGLGGGSLPMFLHNHFPFSSIEVVELDKTIADVAKKYFEFVEDERLQITIADGIERIFSLSKKVKTFFMQKKDGGKNLHNLDEKLSNLNLDAEKGRTLPRGHLKEADVSDPRLFLLVLDVDSDDTKMGMSCPPKEFLEPDFLKAVRECVLENGIVAINVVARSSSMYQNVKSSVKKVFDEVFEADVDEDVNRVLFALPCKSQTYDATKGLTGSAVRTAILATKFAPWGQGPSLVKYASKLKRI